jgi:hypothetical protein
MTELPFKAYFHKSGKMIPVPQAESREVHHAQYVVDHPEEFETTESELRQHSSYPTEVDELQSGKRDWSTSINRFVGKKGFLRSIYQTEKYDTIDPVSKEPVIGTHRSITLHDESQSSSPEDFIASLHHIRNHLLETMGPHDRAYISIGGFSNKDNAHKFVSDKGIKVNPARAVMELKGIDDLNKYLGIPAKRSREPAAPEHVPSSAQVLKNMGKKPEEMPMAQWNMIRRLGDSYDTTSFNALLEKIGMAKKGIVVESGGRRILGANPLQLTSDGLKRHLNKFSKHITLDDGGKHFIIRDKNGNVIHSFTKGKIGPKAALGALTIVRDHLEKIGAYTREKNESEGVGRKRRQNITVEPNEIPQEQKQKEDEERMSAKRDWLKTLIRGGMKERRKARIEAKRKKIEDALARIKSERESEMENRNENISSVRGRK